MLMDGYGWSPDAKEQLSATNGYLMRQDMPTCHGDVLFTLSQASCNLANGAFD